MAEMKVPKYSTKPTIGRIVIYNSPHQGAVPAIVQRVENEQGDVRLCVFAHEGPQMVDCKRSEWEWPVIKEILHADSK